MKNKIISIRKDTLLSCFLIIWQEWLMVSFTAKFLIAWKKRPVIEIRRCYRERYTFCYVLYGDLWCFSYWTSRRRPATAENSYYFIRLISESAFVEAHQWTGTGINRRAAEENEKRRKKRERKRDALFSKFKMLKAAYSILSTLTHSDLLKDSQKYSVILSIGSTFLLQIVSLKSKSYRYMDAHKMNS